MIQRARTTLSDLYEADETAWLDATGEKLRVDWLSSWPTY